MKIKSQFIVLFLILWANLIFCQSTNPDSQFVKIIYKSGYQDELNTFNNALQKDLVIDGVIKVEFWLTISEQNKILQKVKEIKFFDLPRYFPKDPNYEVMPDLSSRFLRINCENEDNTVTWFSEPDEPENKRLNKLKELENLIKCIIYNKPEYKKLPPARGGYL